MRDIWHYPRTRAAEQIVQTLDVGLVSAVAIIEPRRRGKTTFLQDDLAPVASRRGYLCIYVNLAATTGDVEGLIVSTIVAALADAGGLMRRLRSAGSTRIKKVSAKGNVASGDIGGEVEFDPAKSAGQLTEAFSELGKLNRPVLFLLDEVHRLADDSVSATAWSLRSLLDSKRQLMKVVATSSSAASYEVLITGEKKAFNRWFTRVPLAPLADAFVAHLASITTQHFPTHRISQDEIAQAFSELGKSPKFIRDYLNVRILNPTVPANAALRQAVAEAAQECGYEDEFTRLVPLQKTILVALVAGQKELFSEGALKAFGSVLTGEPVSKPLMQRSLKSLADKGWIIKQTRGDYLLSDELFAQWLADQIHTGLLQPPHAKAG